MHRSCSTAIPRAATGATPHAPARPTVAPGSRRRNRGTAPRSLRAGAHHGARFPRRRVPVSHTPARCKSGRPALAARPDLTAERSRRRVTSLPRRPRRATCARGHAAGRSARFVIANPISGSTCRTDSPSSCTCACRANARCGYRCRCTRRCHFPAPRATGGPGPACTTESGSRCSSATSSCGPACAMPRIYGSGSPSAYPASPCSCSTG